MKKNIIVLIIIISFIFSINVYAQPQYDKIISINVGEKEIINVKYPEKKTEKVKEELILIENGKKDNKNMRIGFIVENDNISITRLSNNIYGFKALKQGQTEVFFSISYGGDFIGDSYPGYETSVLIKINNDTEKNSYMTDYEKLNKLRKDQ